MQTSVLEVCGSSQIRKRKNFVWLRKKPTAGKAPTVAIIHSPGWVIAPLAAEPTNAAYFANTPLL